MSNGACEHALFCLKILHKCSIFLFMTYFKNYCNEKVYLHKDTLKHIQSKHKEISLKMIRETIKNPDEIRQSQKEKQSHLYYYFRKEDCCCGKALQ